jgi:CubicO group peptidase (beta-lactamase class C family)
MTHRAGFEEHVKGAYSRNPEQEALGRWLAQNLPRRLFPGGTVVAYSNCGMALAGYIVERVSGERFADYVQRHILNPSATGTDMGRFMRALMNGGELDGVRILSKARLNEMMAAPAGHLGLVFVGANVVASKIVDVVRPDA